MPSFRKFKPRKYIVNPEWRDYQKSDARLVEAVAASGYCMEDYFPEDYNKKLPEDGAWIMMLMSVEVASPTGTVITVPHLSMWFALPATASVGAVMGVYPDKAVIQTPQGEVHVWPHEYNIVKDINEYLKYSEEDGVYINFMNESAGFNTDALFYLMSRGLSRATAQRILLSSLKDPYYCYITLHQSYGEYFGEGFGSGHLVQRRMESQT